MSANCPKCRSSHLRRRVRSGLRMVLASFFGRCPYQCENYGEQFYVRKRHVKSRDNNKARPKLR